MEGKDIEYCYKKAIVKFSGYKSKELLKWDKDTESWINETRLPTWRHTSLV